MTNPLALSADMLPRVCVPVCYSLCPTFSTTFMPCVAQTPPLMLSSPWRVPSDVAVREKKRFTTYYYIIHTANKQQQCKINDFLIGLITVLWLVFLYKKDKYTWKARLRNILSLVFIYSISNVSVFWYFNCKCNFVLLHWQIFFMFFFFCNMKNLVLNIPWTQVLIS